MFYFRFTCDCGDTGFEGVNCEINVDDCQPNPCENGGTCQDGIKVRARKSLC